MLHKKIFFGIPEKKVFLSCYSFDLGVANYDNGLVNYLHDIRVGPRIFLLFSSLFIALILLRFIFGNLKSRA